MSFLTARREIGHPPVWTFGSLSAQRRRTPQPCPGSQVAPFALHEAPAASAALQALTPESGAPPSTLAWQTGAPQVVYQRVPAAEPPAPPPPSATGEDDPHPATAAATRAIAQSPPRWFMSSRIVPGQ